MTDENPYASPAITNEEAPQSDLRMDEADQKKIAAIIKDAGQFWVAIILCVFCIGLGGFIVPIWYLVRLLQWNKFAKKYPELVNPNSPKGSVAAQFRSSQWKLIVGIAFGVVFFLGFVVYMLPSVQNALDSWP
ncbi:MAG: hypothetical protein COA78_12240 [Blastopirellula sp.]|nr:MAG: hypothetical protein COA78_12240 [Blastopirellula sp.]